GWEREKVKWRSSVDRLSGCSCLDRHDCRLPLLIRHSAFSFAFILSGLRFASWRQYLPRELSHCSCWTGGSDSEGDRCVHEFLRRSAEESAPAGVRRAYATVSAERGRAKCAARRGRWLIRENT